MTHATFENSLNQANAKEPAAPQHIAVRALMIMILVPIGLIASVATKAALDPEITPYAVHFVPLMITVAVFHALLLGGAAATLMAPFKRPVLNRAMIYTLIGYGMMGAALTYAVT